MNVCLFIIDFLNLKPFTVILEFFFKKKKAKRSSYLCCRKTGLNTDVSFENKDTD